MSIWTSGRGVAVREGVVVPWGGRAGECICGDMVNGDGGAEESPVCGIGVVKSLCVTFNVPIYRGINGSTAISPPPTNKRKQHYPQCRESAGRVLRRVLRRVL